MKAILNRLIQHQQLSKEEARQMIINIADGQYNPAQIASFLTIYMMRSISLEELEGFRAALLELCIAIDLSEFDTIDLCGTGGDGKDTFNISTLSSFVTAGAGIKVTKHGNYGVSSGCGSSNVLEALGVKFSNDPNFLKRCVDQAGICILHAPLFHPAMKNVAPVRRELGVKTFFNMLGPLVNPARPKLQSVGVFNLQLARNYEYLFQNEDGKRYAILHDHDGYDEVSLTGKTRVAGNNGVIDVKPADFNLPKLTLEQISGGESLEEAATIFKNVLENKATEAQKSVVIANAATAIAVAKEVSLLEAVGKARESLESGKALECFEKLLSLQ